MVALGLTDVRVCGAVATPRRVRVAASLNSRPSLLVCEWKGQKIMQADTEPCAASTKKSHAGRGNRLWFSCPACSMQFPERIRRSTGAHSAGASGVAIAQGSDAKGRTPSHPRPMGHSACPKYNAAATRRRPMMMADAARSRVCCFLWS